MSSTATPAQWLEGARPHTWANAYAPVIAGSAAAGMDGGFHLGRALLAAVVALALIIGVNYANDYSDGIRGTDQDRTGPLRLTGSGLAAPAAVKKAAFISFGVAAVAGVALSALSSWWLVLVGALCIAAAWFYTGGKNPYGYRGLGEVSVFVFFGLVAVLGTQFTQAGRITVAGVIAAVAVGTLSAAVNLTNNLRDIPTDKAAGKITLAVRLGEPATRRVLMWAVLTPLFASLLLAMATLSPVTLLLGSLLPLPMMTQARKVVSSGQGRELIPGLGLIGRSMLLWTVGIAVSVPINHWLFG